MKITKEQNAANAAKTAELFEAETAELLDILTRKVHTLANKAKADASNGKANWGTVGSMGYIVDQLLETLNGFDLNDDDRRTAQQILDTHNSNWS